MMEQGSKRIWKFWNKHRKYVLKSHLHIIRVFSLLSLSAGNKVFIGQCEFDSTYTLISIKAYKQINGWRWTGLTSLHPRQGESINTHSYCKCSTERWEKNTFKSFFKPSFQSCLRQPIETFSAYEIICIATLQALAMVFISPLNPLQPLADYGPWEFGLRNMDPSPTFGGQLTHNQQMSLYFKLILKFSQRSSGESNRCVKSLPTLSRDSGWACGLDCGGQSCVKMSAVLPTTTFWAHSLPCSRAPQHYSGGKPTPIQPTVHTL